MFKVDLKNKQVYALLASDADQNENLISKMKEDQPRDAKIRVFSTNDDVLDMIENGQLGESSNQRVALFCGESGADSEKDEEPALYRDDLRLDCKVVYQKAGIYFSLQAKVQSQNRFAGNWYSQQDYLTLEYNVWYEPKCRDTVYDSNRINNGGLSSELNRRPYENTRGLHYYRYAAIFGNDVIQTRVFLIED